VAVYAAGGQHVFYMNNLGSRLLDVVSFSVNPIDWTTVTDGKRYWL